MNERITLRPRENEMILALDGEEIGSIWPEAEVPGFEQEPEIKWSGVPYHVDDAALFRRHRSLVVLIGVMVGSYYLRPEKEQS